MIPYCLLDMITYMMGGYWYYACQILSSAAEILAEDFQTVIARDAIPMMVTYERPF